MEAKVSPVGMYCKPIEKTVNKTLINLQQGDLTALSVDAWVFYAKENLEIGSGYGTAITMRGGDAVRRALEKIGSVGMGKAVITTAGEMNAKFIIHACGPKFQEADVEKKLSACIKSSLKVAVENNLKTVAFPPMGAGFYGVPLKVCARVMLDSMKAFLQDDTSLKEVIICVIDYRDYVQFKELLEVM